MPLLSGDLPKLARQALERYAHALRDHFGARVSDVRIFGSYARGEAHEASDLDIFVAVQNLTAADKRQAIDLGTDVGFELDLHLSPLVMDQALYAQWLRQERSLAVGIAIEGISS